MIRVNIQVGSGTLGPAVTTVQAESIRQALSIAGSLFPAGEPKVVFPIEPEAFFAGRGAPGPVEAQPLEQAG